MIPSAASTTCRDRGQATVELALVLPVVVLLLCGVVQLTLVVRDTLAVQFAAREAARAASLAADPEAAAANAAAQAVSLRPLQVRVRSSDTDVTAVVDAVSVTDVPLIGLFLPDVPLTASVTMAIEPPAPGR